MKPKRAPAKAAVQIAPPLSNKMTPRTAPRANPTSPQMRPPTKSRNPRRLWRRVCAAISRGGSLSSKSYGPVMWPQYPSMSVANLRRAPEQTRRGERARQCQATPPPLRLLDGDDCLQSGRGSASLVGRTVFALLCSVLATASLLSCGAEVQEPQTELAGKVMWAVALYPDRCDATACQATYQVRLENETDTVLYVSTCRVKRPAAAGISQLPIMGSGLQVRAGATLTWISSFQLSATPSDIRRLTGASLHCIGTGGTGQLVG